MGVALLHRVVSQEATILENKTGVNNIDLRFLNAPRHLADLRAVARPSDVAARQELLLGIQYLLALLRFVGKKRRS
jgi:hypothetical protein